MKCHETEWRVPGAYRWFASGLFHVVLDLPNRFFSLGCII